MWYNYKIKILVLIVLSLKFIVAILKINRRFVIAISWIYLIKSKIFKDIIGVIIYNQNISSLEILLFI